MSYSVRYRILDQLSVLQEQPQRWRRGFAEGSSLPITPSCPQCHTAFIVPRRRVQTTATAIGGVAGAIQGASIAIADAKGISYPLSVIAGAILGGLLGGAAGCAAGAAIGAPIDQTLPTAFVATLAAMSSAATARIRH
jgi:hypothetical protein